jgi:hypothetical protein
MKRGLTDAAAFLEIEEYPQLSGFLKREEERADRKKAWDAERRERGKRVVREWFEKNPCADCGCNDIRVLEADHIMGTRNFTIAESLWRPVKQIEAELKLCESRCSTCHKIRHWEERQQFREITFDDCVF